MSGAERPDYYTISQLGAAFGLSRSTLLYYDRMGILKPEARSAGGYRYYGQRAYERLARICRYRELGLSLKEIRRVLQTGRRPSRKVLTRRLEEVERQISNLETHQRLLRGMLNRLTEVSENMRVDKELWVEMLKVAGMDEEAMRRWHIEFEKRAPDGHQRFLMSLGISDEEVCRIRRWSKGPHV